MTILLKVISLTSYPDLFYLNQGKTYYKIELIQAICHDLRVAISQLKEQHEMVTYRQTLALIHLTAFLFYELLPNSELPCR